MHQNHHSSTSTKMIDAARHLCCEARIVLTSLRHGPPHIARGDLAQDLIDLRTSLQRMISISTTTTTATTTTTDTDDTGTSNENTYNEIQNSGTSTAVIPNINFVNISSSSHENIVPSNDSTHHHVVVVEDDDDHHNYSLPVLPTQKNVVDHVRTVSSSHDDTSTTLAISDGTETTIPIDGDLQQQQLNHCRPHHHHHNHTPNPHLTHYNILSTEGSAITSTSSNNNNSNPYVRPFLRVITDPRASGPHTLTALRSIQRMLVQQPTMYYFHVTAMELCTNILGCKFEQTDPTSDEAVEMAIADVLQHLVVYGVVIVNKHGNGTAIQTMNYNSTGTNVPIAIESISTVSYLPPTIVLDAFNTVFVTRHTFLHTSTALADHFEDILSNMIVAIFTKSNNAVVLCDRNKSNKDNKHNNNNFDREMATTTTAVTDVTIAASLLMEFLVNQLLHTPLVGRNDPNSTSSFDDSTREARQSHDDTRIVCLRLIRRALQVWHIETTTNTTLTTDTNVTTKNNSHTTVDTSRSLLHIVQDDLCLSLLMTGQAIWAGNGSMLSTMNGNTNMANLLSPGFVSLDVLSEICNVLSLLWHTVELRNHLIAQFETIWTGFYTRALVLLRRRPQPINSASLFHANALFDAEVEIILESLVDLLCLHDHTTTVADGNGGTIETLFSLYDCHLRRSDVAAGLLVELSRCCGGTVVDTEGQFASSTTPLRNNSRSDFDMDGLQMIDGNVSNTDGTFHKDSNSSDMSDAVKINYPLRSVPVHLKELCAQALNGGMKCLFRDDHASPETIRERLQRTRSIMVRQMTNPNDDIDNTEDIDRTNGKNHVLRDLKSKKRLLAKAARIFNKKASRGIEFLVDAGLVPDPITPASMASFLRNGIVVGLDKRAIGAYLGEAGKAPIAGKSPPTWERDWFHKDVLRIYCTLFRFEDQTLLDGLRMFLASFRLPGEAQQIDRILQAFSDTCSQVCEESKIGIFSSDPKRASDAAYLLSFSIIMLNTDRHNKNIREDRKMSCDDFYKNNYDYGRDITEKGKEFPREYLASIYDSINEEEIRTEGEGADGAMTVERWKDVLRGFSGDELDVMPSPSDADDVTELVVEHVWRPIISAIGALWNVHASRSQYLDTLIKPAEGNLLGVQGARLGMDMATEILNGVCQLGRVDIFHRLFICICDFTGLLGEYTERTTDRAWAFANSLELQAATIVVIRTAIDSGENLDEECWKRVWAIIFELRDLKIIGRGKNDTTKSILQESDQDLLNQVARYQWTICLEKGDMDYCSRPNPDKSKDKGSSLFGAFGRALFGSPAPVGEASAEENSTSERSVHGKEELVIWDESALSDDEDYIGEEGDILLSTTTTSIVGDYPTLGMQFEELLVRENMDMNRQMDMPVTGLERMDETRQFRVSPRARARRRFRQSCDLVAIISESRFMDELAIKTVIKSLVNLIASVTAPSSFVLEAAPPSAKSLDRCSSDMSLSSSSAGVAPLNVPISPASEAFAEVLICELALKNKDRLKALWTDVLQDHYLRCLTRLLVNPDEGNTLASKKSVDPGLEKRVIGLLRLSICAIKRKDVANEILSAWKYVLPVNEEQHATSPLRPLYRQIGEGLWRIVVDVDSVSANLSDDGWEGLISLISWCSQRGNMMRPISTNHSDEADTGLSEDDPALQCYRTLHLLLSTKELDSKIPCSVLWSLRCLITAGGRRNYAQLSIASLDLLDILHEKKIIAIATTMETDENITTETNDNNFWTTCWRNIMEGIAEAAELSVDTNIRQHALSILTDLFLKKHQHRSQSIIPVVQLCTFLSDVCIPLAGRRIKQLQRHMNPDSSITTTDQLMMEFELCIGLVFKPLRYHLPNIIGTNVTYISSVWLAVLSVLEHLNCDADSVVDNDLSMDGYNHSNNNKNTLLVSDELRLTMNSLAREHLQNAIQVLLSMGVLQRTTNNGSDDALTSQTWASVRKMGFADDVIQQWVNQAPSVIPP